ncbi:hypothetical protein F2Q68_00019167 [Brassica cretica]|uniref:Uncharacterized protein n=1 Tax=Brassica cretica TaxID=69181 RepID=A0A8S9G5M3_BRACR|nr:hypothetical protein F2Q68_00019167 [Brassica cretica]
MNLPSDALTQPKQPWVRLHPAVSLSSLCYIFSVSSPFSSFSLLYRRPPLRHRHPLQSPHGSRASKQYLRLLRRIMDPRPEYDSNCKEIFKGWNCLRNNKTNGLEIFKWRWTGPSLA